MISLQHAVPAVLAAAVLAGAATYFVTSPPTIEVDRRLPPSALAVAGPNTANIGQLPSAEDHGAAAFLKAAAAILRRAQYAQASAGTDEPPITGHIPLPKRRPIPRP
jgi:hypothetical protein